MIANKGQLRRKRGDDLVNQASCLNLITHAVILWNTVYMAEIIARLKREGYPVNESDLPHIWPTRYEHLHVYGPYHRNIEEAQRRKPLMPGWRVLAALRHINSNVSRPRHLQGIQDSKPVNNFLHNSS